MDLDVRYRAFIEAIGQLRPRLHRYCARMTGSALDGEDVVQEALIAAYRKLEAFDAERPMGPWLFRIAHNRCLDFLRRRRARRRAEAGAPTAGTVAPPAAEGSDVLRAVEHLVTRLPPMERACVLLKDVLDHTLEETAEVTGSTVGGVKAALHRARAKLGPGAPPAPARVAVPDLLRVYVERFSRQDWDGVRALVADDAQLRVVDRCEGPLSESRYFENYARLPGPWHLTAGIVDGEAVALLWREPGRPDTVVRLALRDGRIAGITDYAHCAWVLPGAGAVAVC